MLNAAATIPQFNNLPTLELLIQKDKINCHKQKNKASEILNIVNT